MLSGMSRLGRASAAFPADPARRRSLVARLVTLGAVALALVLAWTSTGTPPAVAAWWLAVVVLGVLAPGWVIVRLVRTGGHGGPGTRAPSLVDIGWAGPAGLTWTLLVWATGHLVHRQLPSMAVGALVCGTALLVPAGRARILRRGNAPATGAPNTTLAHPASTPWPVTAYVVTGIALLVAVRWMWSLGLAAVPPTPVAGRPAYNVDLPYQVSLAGATRRAFRPEYPEVAGSPLDYHWFFHAAASQLGGSGLHDLDVVTRLFPSVLLVLLVLLAAAVGHQLIGHWSGAAGAALATSISHPVLPDAWPIAPIRPLQTYWQYSPTATLGWVLGLAVFGCAVAFIRRDPVDAAVPVRLVVPFAVATAGAKSSQLPVLVAGLALAVVVLVVRRRWTGGLTTSGHGGASALGRTVAMLLLMTAAQLTAMRYIYPGSYGLALDPIGAARRASVDFFGAPPGSGGVGVLATGVMAVRRLLPGVLMCVGIGVALRRRVGGAALAGSICLGALLSGCAAVVGMTHPGMSQWYFFCSAVALAVPVGGAYLGVRAAELSQERGRRAVLAALLVSAVLAFAAAAAASAVVAGHGPPARLRGYITMAQALPTATTWVAGIGIVLGACLVLACGAAVALGRGLGRRAAQGNGHGRVASFGLLAGATLASAGLVPQLPVLGGTTYDEAHFAAQADSDRLLGVLAPSPALFEAGQYLRTHAGLDDVVATNRVWHLREGEQWFDPRDFYVSAFSGLRTDVSGYAYEPLTQADAARRGADLSHLSFRDPGRLEAELRLVTAPTTAALGRAYRERGTRWILADERAGVVSPRLGELTEVVFHADGVWLAKLRTPSS